MWTQKTLESLASPDRSITYGVVKPGDDTPDGVVFIRGGDIAEGRINEPALRKISKEVSDQYRRTLLKGGELIVSLVGNPGASAIVPHRLRGANLARQVGVVAIPNAATAQFVDYFLRSPAGQIELQKYMKGSVQVVINLSDLRRVEVPLPDLRTQQRVVYTLSAYDDLIENNTRRIRVLEEMTSTLFHHLFSARSSQSTLPSGWSRQPLESVAEINRAQLSSKSIPSELHYIDIASVSPGSVDSITTMDGASAPGRARRIVQHGDVLWSCVRPNRRSHALVLSPVANTIASTGFAVLTARSVPYVYLYCAVTTDAFVAHLEGRATGAAYPAVTASVFEQAPILVPDRDSLQSFAKDAEPMVELIASLQRRNRALRATRDLLLPRLLSGQLDVSHLPDPDSITLPASEDAWDRSPPPNSLSKTRSARTSPPSVGE